MRLVDVLRLMDCEFTRECKHGKHVSPIPRGSLARWQRSLSKGIQAISYRLMNSPTLLILRRENGDTYPGGGTQNPPQSLPGAGARASGYNEPPIDDLPQIFTRHWSRQVLIHTGIEAGISVALKCVGRKGNDRRAALAGLPIAKSGVLPQSHPSRAFDNPPK